jgi:threonine dehydrogenase-like Zn-dependent dehydrogenase
MTETESRPPRDRGSMRVAVYHSNHDVRLEERPVPAIGPGDLLVKVRASGICGSDVMEWYRIKQAPIVLGHEIGGDVVEVGEGVTAFARGDRVFVSHHVPCGECRYCRRGRESVCDTLRTTHFDPGGLAEYVRIPRLNVEKVIRAGRMRLREMITHRLSLDEVGRGFALVASAQDSLSTLASQLSNP